MSKKSSEYITLARRSIFWLLLISVVIGATYFYQGYSYEQVYDALTASVATKELPIYCVKTDKKQVTLTFDAAWGNGKMRK